MLYLPNIQLNFISFKFIIQISHLLKNKEIINIKKKKKKNLITKLQFMLTKIKMKSKE